MIREIVRENGVVDLGLDRASFEQPIAQGPRWRIDFDYKFGGETG